MLDVIGWVVLILGGGFALYLLALYSGGIRAFINGIADFLMSILVLASIGALAGGIFGLLITLTSSPNSIRDDVIGKSIIMTIGGCVGFLVVFAAFAWGKR